MIKEIIITGCTAVIGYAGKTLFVNHAKDINCLKTEYEGVKKQLDRIEYKLDKLQK